MRQLEPDHLGSLRHRPLPFRVEVIVYLPRHSAAPQITQIGVRNVLHLFLRFACLAIRHPELAVLTHDILHQQRLFESAPGASVAQLGNQVP